MRSRSNLLLAAYTKWGDMERHSVEKFQGYRSGFVRCLPSSCVRWRNLSSSSNMEEVYLIEMIMDQAKVNQLE